MTYPPPWNPQGGPQHSGDPFYGGQPLPPDSHNPFGPPQQPPPGWGQHGAPPPGYPPQPPPGWGHHGAPQPGPRRPGNTGWIIGTVAAVAVVTLVVAGVLWSLNSGGDDETMVAAGTSTTSTTATTSTAPTTTSTTPSTTTTAPAPTVAPAGSCEGFSGGPGPSTPAGWSTVVSPRGLLYDVPPGWEVTKCGTLIGWEKPCADGPFGYCPVRMMSGAATLPNPDMSCKVTLADAGLPGAKNASDINEAVNLESQLVADIYTSESGVVPQVSLSAPRSLTLAGAPAVQIVATVTGIESDACHPPSALHSMVATTVPGQPGAVLFVIALSQDAPGAPDADLIDQMIASVRPAQQD